MYLWPTRTRTQNWKVKMKRIWKDAEFVLAILLIELYNNVMYVPVLAYIAFAYLRFVRPIIWAYILVY